MIENKTCSKCKQHLPIDEFSCTKRNDDGSCKYFNSWCNNCRTIQHRGDTTARVKAKVYSESKECLNCFKILQFSEFSPSKKGVCGLSSYCKECSKSRFKQDKEKAREATRKYRLKHKYRWLAAHRLAMYKRRTKLLVASDGTVTDDFLRYVYSIDTCYWCNQNTPEQYRTLEHIKELNNGGTHSIYNITMACSSCNSARRNKNDKHKGEGCGRQYLISKREENYNL